MSLTKQDVCRIKDPRDKTPLQCLGSGEISGGVGQLPDKSLVANDLWHPLQGSHIRSEADICLLNGEISIFGAIADAASTDEIDSSSDTCGMDGSDDWLFALLNEAERVLHHEDLTTQQI